MSEETVQDNVQEVAPHTLETMVIAHWVVLTLTHLTMMQAQI